MILIQLHEFTLPKQQGFSGISVILEFLASMPSPDEIIALRPSETLQTQANALLKKQRQGSLTEAEQWQQYEYVEHLVQTAKSNTFLKSQRT